MFHNGFYLTNRSKKKKIVLICIGISSMGISPLTFRNVCCCKPKENALQFVGGKTQSFDQLCNQRILDHGDLVQW